MKRLLLPGLLAALVSPLGADEPSPDVTFEPLGMGSFRLDWTGEEGWSYFTQYSPDLQNWLYMKEIFQGVVHDPLDLTPTYEENGQEFTYPQFFVRLRMSDFPTLDPRNADFDGDGLSNWAELTDWGTDPLDPRSADPNFLDGQADTDFDGISDQWEQMLVLQLGDPDIAGIEDIDGLSDSDRDGVVDYQEYQRGLSGYQIDSDGDGFSDRLSVDQAIHLKLDDGAGTSAAAASPEGRDGALLGTPSWQTSGGIMDGALEFAGGTDGVDIPEASFDGLTDLTVSLWFKTQSSAASQSLLSTANAGRAPELGITLEQTTDAADTIRVDAGGGESVKAAEIDEEEHFTIFHYDALNRLVKTIRDMDGADLPALDANGLVSANPGAAGAVDLVTELRYDAVNNLTHQIDPNGTVTRTFHDAIQRPVHVFTGLTLAEADAGLAACTAAAAASREKTHTEFSYDPAKNTGGSAFDSSAFKPTTIIRHDAVLTATGEATLETDAEFDALYRPVRTETEYEPDDFAVTTTAYGTIAAGKESLESTTTVEPGGANAKATHTVMDGLRRNISVTDGFGGTIPATTQTVWSSTGLVWKTIDPLNRETETEYDSAGRPVAVWQPDPITGGVNRNTPNDPLNGSPRTRTAYDKSGNVTVTINPLGYRWEYEYDTRNRRTLERQPTVAETEIVAGQPEERPLDNPLIQTAYDGVGNVIAVTDARGHTTRTFHDQAYQVTDVLTNPVNGEPSDNLQNLGTHDIRVQTAHDANGNPVEVIDGNGNATRNTYDALNRLVTTATNPNNGDPSADPTNPNAGDITVWNTYDDAGDLVQVTDGEGHLTGFRHDGLARKTRTLWDEGDPNVQRTEQATYDGVVQLTRVDPKNQTTTYQYDDLNRLENVIYGTGHADNRHHTYDLVGNLLTVTYPNETAARQVNQRGRKRLRHDQRD